MYAKVVNKTRFDNSERPKPRMDANRKIKSLAPIQWFATLWFGTWTGGSRVTTSVTAVMDWIQHISLGSVFILARLTCRDTC